MKRLAPIVLVLILAGCTKETPAPPRSLAASLSEVSVDTGADVLPLSTFSLGIAHALPVRNTPYAVPSVPAVKSFVVNVPNVPASAIKLYWVRDLDLIFSANQQPIGATVAQRKGAAGYEVAPPALAEKGGYLMLVIQSSGEGPNRYYAVALRS